MTKKNIWIINQYAGSKHHGMNYRSYYIGKELVNLDHHVTLFAGSFSHLLKKLPSLDGLWKREKIDGIDYIWVKTRKYKGSKSIFRTLGMFQFILNLLFIPTKKFVKPDIIVVSSISPLPILNAVFWAKRYQAKLFFEVRDIWPLSLIELGGVSPKHPFVLLLDWIEKYAYRNADKVISVLPDAFAHMKDQGLDKHKFVHIPNGIDCNEALNSNLDCEIDYNPNKKFLIGYLGTVGIANALDYFVEAAEQLKDNTEITFAIVGQGPEKERIQKLINAKALNNIRLYPSVRKDEVQQVLKQFDVCYVGWFKHALYRFGISPNKIFDYMLSGKAILHSSSASNDPIKEAKCGLSCEAEDIKGIANCILKLKDMPLEERKILGEHGRKFVQANHDYKQLAQKYESLF